MCLEAGKICFVLQNSATLQMCKSSIFSKGFLTDFNHFRKLTHTQHFQRTILKRIYFCTTENLLCQVLLFAALPDYSLCPQQHLAVPCAPDAGQAQKRLRVDAALSTELGHPFPYFSPKINLDGIIIAPFYR